LRNTPVGDVIPLDDNILFHKLVAGAMFVAAALHIACHYLDFLWLNDLDGTPIVEQAIGNLAGATGHLVFFMMAIMFTTARECVRRKKFTCCGKKRGGHTIFWYCHKLWMPSLFILCLHGPVFWNARC
jgi:hypothetical protein